MLNAEIVALLRAVLEDVCADVSRCETSARTHVASMLLEAASKGDTSTEDLREVAQKALENAPRISI